MGSITQSITQNDAPCTRSPMRCVVHRRHHVTPPAHHVVAQAGTRGQAILDSLPLLTPSQPEQLYSTEQTSVFLDAGPKRREKAAAAAAAAAATEEGVSITQASQHSSVTGVGLVRTGFQNPWESWHKPTLNEVWNGLRWTPAHSAATTPSKTASAPSTPIDDSISATLRSRAEYERYKSAVEEARMRESGEVGMARRDAFADDDATEPLPIKANIDMLDCAENGDLTILRPDFTASASRSDAVRATWLGHASVLLQLPSFGASGSEAMRILFDPIFSMRCSPTQYLGPTRAYPPPCPVDALPKIDVVCVSHSHYDHLDYESIVQLWKANAEHLRFVVPLGNKSWFLGLGLTDLDEERVTELDWWDEVWLSEEGAEKAGDDIRLICTPAQHGSGRYGFDAGRSLWSSWTVERRASDASVFRAFFGGDTGFQFRSSSARATQYPTCPAFEEVNRMIGAPHLSFLPISVGATFNFVKSYDAFGLVPDLDDGLTGANHMTPFDAVRVAKILTRQSSPTSDAATKLLRDNSGSPVAASPGGVVMAIHWGTFVSGIDEVRQSMRDLEAACKAQDVRFVRQYDDDARPKHDGRDITFACLDHGRSICLELPAAST